MVDKLTYGGERAHALKINEIIDELTALAPSEPVTWTTLAGKPTTFAPIVGTGATQAKAGNYVPSSAEVSTALKAKAQITALTAVAVADATDATTAAALANANKVAINAIIAALKA